MYIDEPSQVVAPRFDVPKAFWFSLTIQKIVDHHLYGSPMHKSDDKYSHDISLIKTNGNILSNTF